MAPSALYAVLEEGRRRGLLGPGPIEPQVEHALAFAEIGGFGSLGGGGAGGAARAVDLGAGGGLPGLVLAVAGPPSPSWSWVFLDSRRRSTEFLEEAVELLGLADRVRVMLARAEDVGRDPQLRGRFDRVVARGFGPPAVTAECAAPLLAVGGRLVVSEPPSAAVEERWPAGPLDRLGLLRVDMVALKSGHFVVLEQVRPCPRTYPRRTGMPAKRPLYGAEPWT